LMNFAFRTEGERAFVTHTSGLFNGLDINLHTLLNIGLVCQVISQTDLNCPALTAISTENIV